MALAAGSPSHNRNRLSLLLLSWVALWATLAVAGPPNVYGSISVLYMRAEENLQAFNGSLGGASASAITPSGDTNRPFSVGGNNFPTFQEAAARSCDEQKNDCSNAANAQGNKGSFQVSDCDTQLNDCKQFQQTAPKQNFDVNAAAAQENLGPDPNDPDFDLICDAEL